VIVPAFNAAATLRETLTSIANQTFQNIEILIIDDGSQDKTREIATTFCDADSRAQVLVNAQNQGVAASRNRGLDKARADWIALIDADDLWHPSHLELLFATAQNSPDSLGMVSASHRRIDSNSIVKFSATPWSIHGFALRQMIYQNFVGNGSAMLVNRAIALRVGGFDERLRQAGAEGCDDLLFQLNVAACCRVSALPFYTVGYRETPGSVSCDAERMYRSASMAFRIFQEAHPDIIVPHHVIRWKTASRLLVISHYKFRNAKFFDAFWGIFVAVIIDPLMTLSTLLHRGLNLAIRSIGFLSHRSSSKNQHFSLYAPTDGLGDGKTNSSLSEGLLAEMRVKRMQKIARIDNAAAGNSKIVKHRQGAMS
jgi:glycosyltransferase involved in cell wall biosynthesis